MDCSNMIINRIVIHEIFKRGIDKQLITPKYGNTLSNLDDDGLEVLQERIINAIGKDSNCMEMDFTDTSDSSIVKIISELLSLDDPEFINRSEQVADKLAEAQTSMKIPGGVVVTVQGTIGIKVPKRFICVIKAEIHSGFTRNNKYILTYLSDLLLTPQQKLYKIAAFIENSEDVNLPLDERFSLLIYDNNMKRADTKDAATYFYQVFLGSTFKRNAKIVTKDFYDFTKEHINNLDVSDDEKFDLNMSLYSYIKSPNNMSISVDDFAKQFLDSNLMDDYKNFMTKKNIPPVAISKDNTYLQNKLKQRRIKFTNEISISGPAGDFKERITVKETDSETTIVEIKGKIQEQQ